VPAAACRSTEQGPLGDRANPCKPRHRNRLVGEHGAAPSWVASVPLAVEFDFAVGHDGDGRFAVPMSENRLLPLVRHRAERLVVLRDGRSCRRPRR